MAVEQIRPDSRAEQGGRLKTQDLNVGAGTAILFKIPRRAADSFISMPRYIQNEGMPEGLRSFFLSRRSLLWPKASLHRPEGCRALSGIAGGQIASEHLCPQHA